MQYVSEQSVRTHNLRKVYPLASGDCVALDGLDLEIAAGEFVAVVGKSGSGKTTLLNLLAGIDRASSGDMEIAGTDPRSLDETRLSQWRGKHIGLVFQFFQLLPTLTVAENVMLPMEFCNTFRGTRDARALELLERMGIADQAAKFPAALSGGQQQRAAIARALANDPPLILADEPTGNLDSHTGDQVLELFASLAQSGKTVVMVTHERDIRRYATRQVTLSDGRVAS